MRGGGGGGGGCEGEGGGKNERRRLCVCVCVDASLSPALTRASLPLPVGRLPNIDPTTTSHISIRSKHACLYSQRRCVLRRRRRRASFPRLGKAKEHIYLDITAFTCYVPLLTSFRYHLNRAKICNFALVRRILQIEWE